jgi:hypothetical protein
MTHREFPSRELALEPVRTPICHCEERSEDARVANLVMRVLEGDERRGKLPSLINNKEPLVISTKNLFATKSEQGDCFADTAVPSFANFVRISTWARIST